MHGGHISRVNDFDWNPNQECSIASVEEDNYLHVFDIPSKFINSN